MSTGQSAAYYSKSFGSFPATFSANPSTDPNHWSFYATLMPNAPPPPTLTISFTPPAPNLPNNSPAGTQIAQVKVTRSDNQPFTGAIAFGPPNGNDVGLFALSGNTIVLTAASPANSTQNLTISATQ
jgi:hypothetical protein